MQLIEEGRAGRGRVNGGLWWKFSTGVKPMCTCRQDQRGKEAIVASIIYWFGYRLGNGHTQKVI